MDAPIVLSHKTAWLYYQASGMGALNENRDIPALTPAQRTPRSFAKSIRKALTACGVDEDELEKLDILISFPFGANPLTRLPPSFSWCDYPGKRAYLHRTRASGRLSLSVFSSKLLVDE